MPISALQADTIYKTVDENGKVSYSTTPPTDKTGASIIDIAAPPSQANVEAAKDRQQRNIETAKQLDENRQRRNEITEQENSLKREKQAQDWNTQQAETNNSNNDYGYPYIPGRRPLIRPPVNRPSRPITLPSR